MEHHLNTTTVLNGPESDLEKLQVDLHNLCPSWKMLRTLPVIGTADFKTCLRVCLTSGSLSVFFYTEMVPDIPAEHLEMDHVHRALTCRQNNGRDTVMKFHINHFKKRMLHWRLPPYINLTTNTR